MIAKQTEVKGWVCWFWGVDVVLKLILKYPRSSPRLDWSQRAVEAQAARFVLSEEWPVSDAANAPSRYSLARKRAWVGSFPVSQKEIMMKGLWIVSKRRVWWRPCVLRGWRIELHNDMKSNWTKFWEEIRIKATVVSRGFMRIVIFDWWAQGNIQRLRWFQKSESKNWSLLWPVGSGPSWFNN